METVTLKLPERLLCDAARVASGQDVTIGHLVRVLLAREVARRLYPKPAQAVAQGLLAALQALLARDIAEATGWADLQARLARHGYGFRPAGGGIALYKLSCGSRICKGSDLGFSYLTLVRRFRAGMPGHPHGTPGEVFGQEPPVPEASPLAGLERLLETASGWEDLGAALDRQGYCLRAHGRGLAIHVLRSGRFVCNTATVRHRYRALVKRFGAPLPGHRYGSEWVPGPGEPEDAFDVIERDVSWKRGTAGSPEPAGSEATPAPALSGRAAPPRQEK